MSITRCRAHESTHMGGFWPVWAVQLGMTQMNFVHRSNRGGKVREMADHLAERSGLPATTCADLLRHGWTYMEFKDEQSRWEAPAPKLPPKPTPNHAPADRYGVMR